MTGQATDVVDTTNAAEDHSDAKPDVATPIGQSATQDEVQQAFNQATPDNTGE